MRYHRELNVSTVLDRYMKDHYIPNRGTKKTPEKNLRNITSQWSRIKNLKSILGDMPAKSLRREDLDDYILKRKQVVLPVTILREIRVLTAALNKVLPNNTATLVSANIKGHQEVKGYPRPAYIKDEHYHKILKELDEVAPYMVPIIKIIHWCGARSDEIKGLMWHEIDWDEGRINLPPERTKEERSKSMILNDECLTELLTIKENCDKTKKGTPLSKYVFLGPTKKNAKLNERQYYLK